MSGSTFLEWGPQLLGPGGALLVLLIVGRMAFNFFTTQLTKMEKRYDAQEERFNKLHSQTLQTVSANTRAIERLTDKIANFIGK